MGGSRGGTGGPDFLPEKSQKYKVSQQNWSDPLKNHKATKPAFNVGPSLPRQQSAMLLLPAYSDIYILSKKKNVFKVGPPRTKLSGSTHCNLV